MEVTNGTVSNDIKRVSNSRKEEKKKKRRKINCHVWLAFWMTVD